MTLSSHTPIRTAIRLLAGTPLFLLLLADAGWAAEATGPKTLSPEGFRRLEAKEKARALRAPDSPDEAQEHFVAKRAPVGTKALPVERYLTAQEQMRRMPQHSTARDTFLPSRAELEEKGISYVAAAASLGAWSALGPGNVGGRTRTLVLDPRQPEVMYAGGVAGGVWKTTDGGQSWRPLADLMANLGIASLAMDPANSNILYAGTGEVFTSVGVRGSGIFRTTDGGNRWERLAATNNASFYFVSDIVISSSDSSRLYAATATGVWRSTNGGASWQRTLATGVQGGCLDLVIRKDRAEDVVFAACGNRGQEGGAVYRNANAQNGDAWEQVLQEPGMGRASLALAPSNQDVIYALTASNVAGPSSEQGENYRNGMHAVFRSTSGGGPGTWTAQVRNNDSNKLNRLLLSRPMSAFFRECGDSRPNIFSGQGSYDNTIAVDPVNPDRVWTGGIDLFRSDDGGRNWGIASYWWAIFPYSTDSPSYVHADQHLLVFHPNYDGASNKTLYVTNDGGVFRTDDALAPTAKGVTAACNSGNSQLAWTGLNNGYGVTQFYHGTPFPDGKRYLGGTQDNGSIQGRDGQGANAWETVLGGDGGYSAVNPKNPDIVYASYQLLSLQKSVDGGFTWHDAVEGIDSFRTLFIAPYVMDPNDPERLWFGGEKIYRTDDGAEFWNAATAPLTGRGMVSALAVARRNSDRVLAGTNEGYILRTGSGRTADASTEWPAVRPRPGYVSSVTFDPTNPSVVYATYSTFGGTHVWKSTNGGATWKGIDGKGNRKIPDIPVHSLVVDPKRPSRLYVGTDLGVFVSTNGGRTWAVENTGFANVITEWLTLLENPSGRTLFAFTHGRGAWRVPIRN